MAAKRTKINIVKFKSHHTVTIRYCLKFDDNINNSLHTLFHCPMATFMWDLARDIIKILLGVSIIFDIRAALINFYLMKNSRLYKNSCAKINVIILITRRVLYAIYYREDKVVKNNIIKYELTKNIRIIQKFRKELLVFLNHHINTS